MYELILKLSLQVKLQQHGITESGVANGLTKHTHTIITVRNDETTSGKAAVYTSRHPTGTHITAPRRAMK
jgi:hypothetical protein